MPLKRSTNEEQALKRKDQVEDKKTGGPVQETEKKWRRGKSLRTNMGSSPKIK